MSKESLGCLFFLLLSSCNGCNDPKEAHNLSIYNLEPKKIDFIEIPNIDEKDAQNPYFWESHKIEDRQFISPIMKQIISDSWDKNGAIWIMLSGFLASKNNVAMLNLYKNHSPLNKILFYIAQTINLGQNITKYEEIFCKKFTERLKLLRPDDYETILKDPTLMELHFQSMVVDDINEKNPESINKIAKYSFTKETNRDVIRKIYFISDNFSDYDYIDPYVFLYILDNENTVGKKLFQERKNYLQNNTISDSVIEEISETAISTIQMNNIDLDTNRKINKIKIYLNNELLKESIKKGKANYFTCTKWLPTKEKFYSWKDRYFIEANDDEYHISLGNKDLKGMIFLNFDFDKETSSYFLPLSCLVK